MKSLISVFLITALVFGVVNCASSPDPEPQLTEEEIQINRLAGTWILGKVTYGDDDVTGRFGDFALAITKTRTYTTAGSLGDYDYEPFEVSGSWVFKDGNLNIIRRNDGVEMDVQVSENDLVLTFVMAEANGRVAGLGAYRFDLVSE